MRKTFVRLLALVLTGCLLFGLVACTPATVPGGDDPNQGNTGNENTGNENTGNENTGNENTGNENTGNENTGNENTGNENTGNENTGNENTGSGTTKPQPPSAAVGTLTGEADLDEDLKEIIDGVTNGEEDKLEQLRAVYQWVADNFRYRAVSVDLSAGYTEALQIELAEYFLKYRRASCEHYAVMVALLFQRLDPAYKPVLVSGDRWDTKNQVWGEHAWVIMEYEGRYYHFDGLYGKNHQGDTFRSFMKTDAEMREHHRWDETQYPACP